MLPLFLPLLAAARADAPYVRVAGLEFSDVTPYQFAVFPDAPSLTYTVYQPQHSGYGIGMIRAAVQAASEVSLREIHAMAPTARPCDLRPLEIYEVAVAVLNDPSRFPAKYIGSPENGRGPLWGYFDPQGNASVDTIVLSDHGEVEDRRILEHEIGHRWYAAYCLDRFTTMSSEDFAVWVAAS